MERNQRKAMSLKLGILWLAIFLLASFWMTVRAASEPVSMTAMPQVPREGEPIVATFKLSNPLSHDLAMKYQFYADGQLLREGSTVLAPQSSGAYQYAYSSPVELGEQVNFVVRTQSELGDHEEIYSLPAYPPQVWSSFVSFASFSTSVMSSMSTMAYYQMAFSVYDVGFNTGFVVTGVLIILLIFVELTHPAVAGKVLARVGSLRLRFSLVSWLLFIIFMGTVYTRIVMVLTQ